MQRHADGSVDLWLQHAPPEPARCPNWLPAPAAPFALTLRYDLPRQPLLDCSFVTPDIEPRA